MDCYKSIWLAIGPVLENPFQWLAVGSHFLKVPLKMTMFLFTQSILE